MATSSNQRSRPHRRSRRHRRRARRRLLRLFGILGLLGAIGYGAYHLWTLGMLPANETSDDWFEVEGKQEVLVQLPHDDAPHQDQMEWWYYNGHLDTNEGNNYSFHFTVFLINALATHTVAHVSFYDHQTGQHFTDETRTTGSPSRGTTDRFDFKLGDWHMTGSGGQDRLRAGNANFSFNLQLTEGAPPVMQGGTGILDFELAGKSYYYSRPRMPIRGSIKVGDNIERVTGTAWFDHQWGDFEVNQLGWDWFALQLDDGSDIMLYRLFDSVGLPVLSSGTLTSNGVTTVLSSADVKLGVTDYWISEQTGIKYPMGWNIEIPDHSIDLSISPVNRNGEFDGRLTSYKVYWEGPITISGTHGGRGFVEMSGYEREDKDAGQGGPADPEAASQRPKK